MYRNTVLIFQTSSLVFGMLLLDRCAKYLCSKFEVSVDVKISFSLILMNNKKIVSFSIGKMYICGQENNKIKNREQ